MLVILGTGRQEKSANRDHSHHSFAWFLVLPLNNVFILNSFYSFARKALQFKYSCGLACSVCLRCIHLFIICINTLPVGLFCFVGVGGLKLLNLLPQLTQGWDNSHAPQQKGTLTYLYLSVLLLTDMQVVSIFCCHNQFQKTFLWAWRHGSNHYIHHLTLSGNVNGLENYFSLSSLPTLDTVKFIQLMEELRG